MKHLFHFILYCIFACGAARCDEAIPPECLVIIELAKSTPLPKLVFHDASLRQAVEHLRVRCFQPPSALGDVSLVARDAPLRYLEVVGDPPDFTFSIVLNEGNLFAALQTIAFEAKVKLKITGDGILFVEETKATVFTGGQYEVPFSTECISSALERTLELKQALSFTRRTLSESNSSLKDLHLSSREELCETRIKCLLNKLKFAKPTP